MILKGILWEDIVNYKKTAMMLIFPYCSFKCDKENGCQLCQNWELSRSHEHNVSEAVIINTYMDNPLTHAVVCGGLEPLDSWNDLYNFIEQFREVCSDDIVIYTGYREDEVQDKIEKLKKFKNIIVKFGRYRPNQEAHLDPILGVKLANDEQYAVSLQN